MVRSLIALLSLVLICGAACSQVDQTNSQQKETPANTSTVATTAVDSAVTTTETSAAAIITFIELGSVNCVPCKKMQPVMESIEQKYGAQIEVVFHDVWKDPAPGEKYGIKMIPTQVFLDADGNELLRHVGFFPETEIDAFLQKQGLTIVNPPAQG